VTPELRKWCELVASLFGVLGFLLMGFGALMLSASYRLWHAAKAIP